MDKSRTPKKILNSIVYNTKRRGGQNEMDVHVTGDLKTMKVAGWGYKARDRMPWRSIAEKTKIHSGLLRRFFF